MATLADRELTVKFSGLTSTAITAVVFLTVGFVLEEVLKQLRRYPDEDKRRARGENVRDRGLEGWAMGYLYRARTYVPVNPTKDYDPWPLMWIWRAAWLPEKFYAESCGPDATVYVRFLRGAFYWTLFLTCTVFPVLTSLNWIYSPPDVSRSSIDRASLSSLALSDQGSHLLYVHVLCLWLLSFAWIGVLAWIGYGAVRIRRNVLRSLIAPIPVPHADIALPAPNPADLGWRFRSVLVRNIPDAMRSEAAICEYFEFHLRDKLPDADAPDLSGKPFPLTRVKSLERERTMGRVLALGRKRRRAERAGRSRIGEDDREGDELPLIAAVVLVRKQNELNELWIKYKEVLHLLETAHVVLAQNAVAWARERVARQEREGADGAVSAGLGEKEKPLPDSPEPISLSRRLAIFLHLAPPLQLRNPDLEAEAREDDEFLFEQLRPFLAGETVSIDQKTGRERTMWHVLHDLDPVYLDRFQPLYKLRHFRGQKVPSIDYFLTKLNLLSALIEDKRANPEAFEPASSAFVTFSRASDARRARHELRTRPGTKIGQRVFECKVKWAPETRDLDWNKICRVSLSGDLVRGAILQTGIWAATVFWVIPLSFLVGLLSLNSISKYIPALAVYLNAHSAIQSLFSNLLPTSIVALLGMLVPTLIGILTRNGQVFITVSKLHSAVQARYWKWLMVNIILVFCIGISAFTAFLNAFRQPTSVLAVVAAAFPKGATFFVSWALLVVGVHHGIEQSLFGIPFINHATIRNLKSPRKREEEALPRSFSYFYWLPNHLLVTAVTCIFAILNPMILPFTLVYQAFSLSVFKNQFAHVYWRRWYEGQGRQVFRRLFRYSLDCFLVAQVVGLALFEVLKLFRLGGAIIPLIPITAFVKLIGTRWFDQLMDEIDEVEAELMCGHRESIDPSSLSLSVPLARTDEDLRGLTWHQRFSSIASFTTRTLPALTFRPNEGLPSVPSPHDPNHEITTSRQQRLNSHSRVPTSLDDDRPILGTSRESSADSTHETDPLQHTSRDVQPEKLPVDANPEHELLTPHAPIIRDDRPVSHLHYANPAVVEPLAHGLWLPRDPLLPLDLGDTVNYHGHALVSSEGGRGVIGSWDEHISDAQALETIPASRQASQDIELGRISSVVTSASSPVRQLDGTERIRVASDIAARVEAEGGSRPVGGRRESSGGESSIFPPGMRRRSTNASASSAGMGSFIIPGPSTPSPRPTPSLQRPHESPSYHRNHLAPPSTSPGIPSFTAEPEPLADPEGVADFPFPPRQRPQPSRETTPIRGTPLRAPTRQSRSTSFSLAAPPSPRSPRSPSMNDDRRASIPRQRRAASHAPSMQASIAERLDEDDEGAVSVSQAEALRREVLEEESREHAKRVEKEASDKAKERGDKKNGWLHRMMVRHSEVGET